jgi:hypothetical protein
MLFVRAYQREPQEMVFDAHDRAFALFKGSFGRRIYDNIVAFEDAPFLLHLDQIYEPALLHAQTVLKVTLYPMPGGGPAACGRRLSRTPIVCSIIWVRSRRVRPKSQPNSTGLSKLARRQVVAETDVIAS